MAEVSTTESSEQHEQRLLTQDRALVDAEIKSYCDAGLLCLESASDTNLDLVSYWGKAKEKFPILFHLAMDILPIQASAVPCERVFSSSKETDTLRRSKLGMGMVEILQILKYSLRQERLSFTSSWLPKTGDLCGITSLTAEEITAMLSEGKFEEVLSLVQESE